MRNNKYESGRSMVEMLGTLAIIGVLSIGGIAGYKYGMDKYRANQTINDVMLMGVDIITQLSQNRGTPTLSSDWGTKTTAGYDFTVVQNPEDKTQYGIQITGVPISICKQVGDGLKQTVAVYVGNEDYNSDTETDPCDESDSNTMEFYFEKSSNETNTCNPACSEGEYCDNGVCFKGEKPVYSYGGQTCTTTDDCPGDSECISWCDSYSGCSYYSSTTQCTNDVTGKSGVCSGNGECIEGDSCSYDQYTCGEGKYCATSSNCSSFNTTGRCAPIDFVRHTIQVNGKSEIWYISNVYMSARDAEVACRSMGKTTFPSRSDFIEGSAYTERATAFMDVFGLGQYGDVYLWTSETYDGTGGEKYGVVLRRTFSDYPFCEGIAVCK